MGDRIEQAPDGKGWIYRGQHYDRINDCPGSGYDRPVEKPERQPDGSWIYKGQSYASFGDIDWSNQCD